MISSNRCLLFMAVIAALTGCKKDNNGNRLPATGKKVLVTTIAGIDSIPGYENGPALAAKFAYPFDVAVAQNGAIYITDLNNRRIRKLMNGQVTTFAGSGVRGIVNADGEQAQFEAPFYITIDAKGNLYSSDEEDARIRKISAAGNVTIYAGNGLYGFANGDADTSRFDGDMNLATGNEGNVFVADIFNYRIRKISTANKVSTVAGNGTIGFNNGPGEQAAFNLPEAIVVDKQDNLYVYDKANFRVRKITPDGIVSTLAGSGTQGTADGNAAEAQFGIEPHDMVIDGDGNLYISDNNRIRKITQQGLVSTIAGSTAGFADGDGATARFNQPTGLGIDVVGNIYVADFKNNRIRKISFQ